MRGDFFPNTGQGFGFLEDGLGRTDAQRPADYAVLEQELRRGIDAPIFTEQCQQRWGQGHIPIFKAFSLSDSKHPPAGINICNAQCNYLRNPQPGPVQYLKERPVLDVVNTVDEQFYLPHAHDQGQGVTPTGSWHLIARFRPAQYLDKKHLERAVCLDEAGGGAAPRLR